MPRMNTQCKSINSALCFNWTLFFHATALYVWPWFPPPPATGAIQFRSKLLFTFLHPREALLGVINVITVHKVRFSASCTTPNLVGHALILGVFCPSSLPPYPFVVEHSLSSMLRSLRFPRRPYQQPPATLEHPNLPELNSSAKFNRNPFTCSGDVQQNGQIKLRFRDFV
jgi:hypothetical protein